MENPFAQRGKKHIFLVWTKDVFSSSQDILGRRDLREALLCEDEIELFLL